MNLSPAEQGTMQEAFQRQMDTATLVTGRLAHDFGNILTGILGFAELSLTHLPAESPARRYVEEIVHSAQNGAGWVRKLQAFSRRSKPRARPIPLAPSVAKEEERLSQAWGNRVTFLVALPEDLPRISAEADSLQQLLRQLLDNAGEAIPERGVVTLSARTVELSAAACRDLYGNAQAGSHVELTITDSGTGLSADVRQRLFRELFFTTKARRRGLGLALVHSILQTFQGGLCFGPDSEQGTTVRLFLPVAGATTKQECPSAEAQGRAPAPSHAGADGPVLVVDDDPQVLRLVSQILADAGFEVQAAAGAHQAIELCRAKLYRLIVSDIVMPRMNGFELIRHLQAQDIVVNVLFISNQPINGLATDALLDQFPLLKKPFMANDLVEAAAAALARAPAPTEKNQTPVLDILKEVIP